MIKVREGVGHNSGTGEVDGGHLRAFVERIERLHEERTALSKDIADVYGESKANGFDVPVLKKVIALRRMDPAKRVEQETILDLYRTALGDA